MEEVKNKTQKCLFPQAVLNYLNKNVIGQDRAKESISIAIANHINTINHKNWEIPKSNTIIVGETGTGKTLLMQELKKFVKRSAGIRLCITDATKITDDGYIGQSVSDIVAQLFIEADSDASVAEKSIIYIDEIDKLLHDPNNSKGRIGVFNSLLKIIEGTTLEISNSSFQIDTAKMLFIVGGVFEGLNASEAGNNKTMGFCRKINENNSRKINNTEANDKKIDARALIEFGLPAEFVGRFNIIANLDNMSKETLKRVMTQKVIPSYEKLFSLYGKKLDLTKEEIEKNINDAVLSRSGARGLYNFLEDKLRHIIFKKTETKGGEHINKLNF